ncbi:unnamed protein product [Gongylonema pulchrum]|uniref:Uncharacterized protein n=1 Tax=Gongylonema pulchrum TaxID=637853 RepID=A0A183E0P9_9BILA|nr:unnamed protein product [Gongylonema pulchrum]
MRGVRIKAHIRGCLDELLYNGFNQTIVTWYRWMHRDSCRQYRCISRSFLISFNDQKSENCSNCRLRSVMIATSRYARVTLTTAMGNRQDQAPKLPRTAYLSLGLYVSLSFFSLFKGYLRLLWYIFRCGRDAC